MQKELARSELFGHLRGSFTGAVENSEGFMAFANKGTLFLDEIGELPIEVQAALLRVATGLPAAGSSWRWPQGNCTAPMRARMVAAREAT